MAPTTAKTDRGIVGRAARAAAAPHPRTSFEQTALAKIDKLFHVLNPALRPKPPPAAKPASPAGPAAARIQAAARGSSVRHGLQAARREAQATAQAVRAVVTKRGR